MTDTRFEGMYCPDHTGYSTNYSWKVWDKSNCHDFRLATTFHRQHISVTTTAPAFTGQTFLSCRD